MISFAKKIITNSSEIVNVSLQRGIEIFNGGSMKQNNFKEVKDDFQAFLIENAKYTKQEGYPILKKSMVAKKPPEKIIPFDRRKQYSDKEIKESYICFYASDASMVQILHKPRKYLKLFKRCKGLIGFDFSVYSDMPLWVQREYLGKNLSLDFFFGDKHCPIIPNIRWGSEELIEGYLEAIPKNCLIEVGTYGFIKTKQEKATWKEFLEIVIEKLSPTGIIVYGSAPEDVFGSLKINNIPVYQYDSFMTKRMKGERPYVKRNKR